MKKIGLKKNLLLTIGLTTLFSNLFIAQSGSIDNTWGNSGWISTDHYVNDGEEFYDMIPLQNDKFLLVGAAIDDVPQYDVVFARYNSDGTLDQTFGYGGSQRIDLSIGGNDSGISAYELNDKKVLITGFTYGGPMTQDLFVMRINEDGTTDGSFGTSGTGRINYSFGNNTITKPQKIIQTPNNEIFVGGWTMIGSQKVAFILKLTQGGGIDVSFGNNGVFVYTLNSVDFGVTDMEIDDSGNIYLSGTIEAGGGYNGFLLKVTSSGVIDSSFSGTGVALNFDGDDSYFDDFLLDEGGKIIVVGRQVVNGLSDGLIVKYNTDGTIDQSFGSLGKIILDNGTYNHILLNNIRDAQGGNMIVSGNATGVTEKEVFAFMFDNAGNAVCSFGSCEGAYYNYFFVPVDYYGVLSTILSDGSILLGGYATSQDFIGSQMYVFKVLNIDQYAGLTENNIEDSSISIYPNPVQSKFNLKLDKSEEIREVHLIGLDGRTVQSWYGNHNEYEFAENISTGKYIVKVITSSSVYSCDVIVKQ